MKNVFEAAAALRELANNLDALHAALVIPAETLTLQGAIDRLRPVMDEKGFSLDLVINCYSFMKTPEVEYKVYDAGLKEVSTGATLEAAVNEALAARTPPPANPVEAADLLVSAQLAEQERLF